MSEPIIKVKNLKREFKQYRKLPGITGTIKSLFKREYLTIPAVKDISFEIAKGEMIGFIGPNGAGKTTTLKMLSGLLHPSSGEISVMGEIPYQRSYKFLKKLSLVLGQKAQLWWDLPAIDSFLLNRDIYEIPEAQFRERINELSELMDVTDILNIQVRRLSLGQRMKCELLAALLHQPELLLLDEPTIGLDVVVQKKIRQFFKDYNHKYQTTVLLTSHYMDDVQELCKRLIIIDHGQIVYDGGLSELVSQFAPDKYLNLVFQQAISENDLKKFGKVVNYDNNGYAATIAVPRAEHTKVAAAILSTGFVDDLDIQEPGLEEVIRGIFAR